MTNADKKQTREQCKQVLDRTLDILKDASLNLLVHGLEDQVKSMRDDPAFKRKGLSIELGSVLNLMLRAFSFYLYGKNKSDGTVEMLQAIHTSLLSEGWKAEYAADKQTVTGYYYPPIAPVKNIK